jgi:hypothetical protein
MSNHEMPPQALTDPGLAIVTTGNLRGPILSVLRAACAPVKISEVLGRYHPDLHPRARDTLRDLADLGMVHLSATHATALRGNGNPYRSTERREVVECVRPVQEERYTVPMPTHTPESRGSVARPPKKKRVRDRRNRPVSGAAPGPVRKWSVEEARSLRESGVSLRQIAERMGVCHKSVQRALGLCRD